MGNPLAATAARGTSNLLWSAERQEIRRTNIRDSSLLLCRGLLVKNDNAIRFRRASVCQSVPKVACIDRGPECLLLCARPCFLKESSPMRRGASGSHVGATEI